ncbi:hypothetical protein [Stigmatella aurantiaca]|uniref:Conserved uncharacterized protein n=1 Tax=Stigmatella aurantiaca (strain DW4/3-1) TaxID=378806 RepID=E3FIA2_STIAD|nr:hypothetical protein [Stigmatella aurantiaca]ADO72892.1 conserved uncharacterized protein [Stigmatella aurantiaca DW4/3-1]
MWVWLKMVLAMAVALLPGGFPLLLAYVTTRTLRARWRVAREQAAGRAVTWRDVVATLHFKDLVREARAAL